MSTTEHLPILSPAQAKLQLVLLAAAIVKEKVIVKTSPQNWRLPETTLRRLVGKLAMRGQSYNRTNKFFYVG